MKYLLLIFGLLTIQSCGSKNAKNGMNVGMGEQSEQSVRQTVPWDSINGAYLHLDRKRYDFGKISRKKMPDIPIEFEIENIGKDPLVILKAGVS